MTNERKLELLNEMKNLIKSGSTPCLCGAYYEVTGILRGDEEIIKLGISKPKETYNKVFWFPIGDSKSRIKLINNAIKKLQCK